MRYFLKRSEYLFGVTADLNFASYAAGKGYGCYLEQCAQ